MVQRGTCMSGGPQRKICPSTNHMSVPARCGKEAAVQKRVCAEHRDACTASFAVNVPGAERVEPGVGVWTQREALMVQRQ